MKSLGADYAFDYRAPDLVTSIKAVAPELEYVFDTIGGPQSSATASEAICDRGGALCTVRPGKANTEGVTQRTKISDVLVWTAFLKEHKYGSFTWPVSSRRWKEIADSILTIEQANKDDHELASELFSKLPEWLSAGTIKPNTPKVLKGLAAVPEGFQEYREGKISGYKIVYELEASA